VDGYIGTGASKFQGHRAANTTGSTGYKDNAGGGFGHGVLQIRWHLKPRRIADIGGDPASLPGNNP
jgi:hypothetical protein